MTLDSKSQLILDFPHEINYEARNFMRLPSNADAYDAVMKFPTKIPDVLVIYGPTGVGKTHLLNIWANTLGDRLVDAEELREVPFSVRKIAIDHLEKANRVQQENLFFLFNHLASVGGALLVASDKPVAQMDLIPEIRSRLLTGTQVEVKFPEEEHLEMLMVKWAKDRQVELDPAVISYLLKRVERSPSILMHLLEKLDKLSIVQKKAITVAVARQALGQE